MLKVTIGTNTSRKAVVVSPDKTLRDVLTENGVNLNVGKLMIDGGAINANQLDQTLAEIGVQDNAYIISVAKADNA